MLAQSLSTYLIQYLTKKLCLYAFLAYELCFDDAESSSKNLPVAIQPSDVDFKARPRTSGRHIAACQQLACVLRPRPRQPSLSLLCNYLLTVGMAWSAGTPNTKRLGQQFGHASIRSSQKPWPQQLTLHLLADHPRYAIWKWHRSVPEKFWWVSKRHQAGNLKWSKNGSVSE